MKVVIEENYDLLIRPETDFEENYLRTFWHRFMKENMGIKTFLKFGSSYNEISGLKVSLERNSADRVGDS